MTGQTERRKNILSGIQPTGVFTLGNYVGAIRNWEKLQEDYNSAYMIADMHAITVRQDPKLLKQQILTAFAAVLACGINPQKSLVFLQSQVPEHAQLSWILSCYTQFGELSRMTQFKDKSAKNSDNINAGLFTYPSLMAADILLYQADLVPVGDDQKQHLELARDIANRFNSLNGKTFTLPDGYIPKVGARIMSLADPTKKMSKSDDNLNGFVSIFDTPDAIMKKFKRAVTDSEAVVKFGEDKHGINNLMTIFSVASGKSFEQIENEFEGKGYGDFKIAVGESVVEQLRPVRERFEQLMNDKAYLEECYINGAAKASRVAKRTLDKVYKKVGFII